MSAASLGVAGYDDPLVVAIGLSMAAIAVGGLLGYILFSVVHAYYERKLGGRDIK